MGIVYQAQQFHPIRRDVALKIIKPGMDSRQVITRFESERQALALMDHPNIAHVYDAGTTAAGLPYFAMELVDGVPITRYCDSHQLTVKQRIELLIPVCRAIQHAHQKGIIHRDLKPSNILVTELEGKAAPKVIDFGLAKALGQLLSDATVMTNLGTVVGTLDYMSPEQADIARSDVDTRSDVYSMGAVLYELLTGVTPLEQERLAESGYIEALRRIRDEETPAPSMRVRRSTNSSEIAARRQCEPSRLPKVLHGELDWIAMKALEKDRARRYETANAMARDLQRYMAGEPVEAAPPSARYRLSKFVRKYRVWLATGSAFTALLFSAAVVSSLMAIRATRAEHDAIRERNTATAVIEFLRNDLLAQASAKNQARPDVKPDPDLKVRTALDRAAAQIGERFGGQPILEASIRHTIGTTYRDLGLHPEAQQNLERALDLRRRALGETNLDTLATMDELAGLYRDQGKYGQAEPIFTRVVEARRKVLGDENPDTIDSTNGLAQVYMWEGRYNDAERLYTHNLDVLRRIGGEEHPKTIESMAGLGAVYYYKGQYSEAERLQSRTLDFDRRIKGEEHPDTVTAMNNLAATFNAEEKYGQAEELLRACFDVRKRILGEAHPRTLIAANNLAQVYRREGKYSEAERLTSGAFETGKRVLGEDRPETLALMETLATINLDLGDQKRAEALLTPLLLTRRRVLGEHHRDTMNTRYWIGELNRHKRNFPASEQLFTEVLAWQRQSLGERSKATIRTLVSLGEVQAEQQKYNQAEISLRGAQKRFADSGSDEWNRFDCESLLGASLAGQKRYEEAEKALLAGYEGLIQRKDAIPKPARSALVKAEARIIKLYQDWGKQDKTAEWRRKVQAGSASLNTVPH
jgi:non-specific serine/threonine protein kinase/serine/threonine-protein kinase